MRKDFKEDFFTRTEQEYESRSSGQKGDILSRIIARGTPRQREFLGDEASHIALCCGRRATKTYGLGLKLAHSAQLRPYAVCYYLTERKERARELMWDSASTGLKKLNDDLALGMKFNNTYLEAHVPTTKAVIKIRGAETRADVDKLRGEPADLFVLDEVRNWENPKLLDHLIENVLEPSTIDHKGQLVLASNPGVVLAGTFYEATRQGSPLARPWEERETWAPDRHWLWSVHRWTAKDNTAMPHIWKGSLKIKEQRGWSDENPTWRREYLGEWIVDGSNMVFRLNPEINLYDPDPKTQFGLPAGHNWKFLCGMDFGVQDDFALVVAATAETHPVMYEVYAFSRPGMIAAEIKEVYEQARTRFGSFDAVVGDVAGIGKGFELELSRTQNIEMEAAEKQKKLVYIEMLNSDMVEGRIKIRRISPLRDEMAFLQWSDQNRKHKTVRGQKDHLSDAFVYLWRRSSHNEAVEVKLDPAYGTKEWAQALAEKEKQRVMRPPGDTLDGESRMESYLDTWRKGLLS